VFAPDYDLRLALARSRLVAKLRPRAEPGDSSSQWTPTGYAPGPVAGPSSTSPATDSDDSIAVSEGTLPLGPHRSFTVEHWDYDATRIDGWNYDIGARLVRAATAVGEADLVAVLAAWGLLPRGTSPIRGTPPTEATPPPPGTVAGPCVRHAVACSARSRRSTVGRRKARTLRRAGKSINPCLRQTPRDLVKHIASRSPVTSVCGSRSVASGPPVGPVRSTGSSPGIGGRYRDLLQLEWQAECFGRRHAKELYDDLRGAA
jgi:hypothetical protein